MHRVFKAEDAAWEWLELKVLEEAEREAERAKPRTRSSSKRFSCYAVADVPGWGVYGSWETAMSFHPKRYKAFTDERLAWEWLDAQDEAAASAALPRGKFRFYAVRDTHGFGLYTKWATVRQLRPRSYKGFNDEHLARCWLDGPDPLGAPSKSKRVKRRKKRPKSKTWYAVAVGRRVGVFSSWQECKEQVIGVDGGLHEAREAAEAFVEKHRDHHEGAKQKAKRLAKARESAPAGARSVSTALRERHAAAVAEAERAPRATTPSGLSGAANKRVEGPAPNADADRMDGGTAWASDHLGVGGSDVGEDKFGVRAGEGASLGRVAVGTTTAQSERELAKFREKEKLGLRAEIARLRRKLQASPRARRKGARRSLRCWIAL